MPALQQLAAQLHQLSATAQPLFGTLGAQRMVEHLGEMLQLSITEDPQRTLLIAAEKLPKWRAFLLSDTPMGQGGRTPYAWRAEVALPNLTAALAWLDEQLVAYEAFFAIHPQAQVLHPYCGQLGKAEWDVVHRKHFEHHLRQFGLLALNS